MSFLINGFEWKEGSLIKPFSQVTARTMVWKEPPEVIDHTSTKGLSISIGIQDAASLISLLIQNICSLVFYSMYHRILFRVICA